MDSITLKAMAKINLGLDVVRRRPDGYHEVKMIMQMLNLYDRVYIERTERPGIVIETNLSFLPTDERNIAYKAAKLLMDEFDITDGVTIKIDKRIPVAAGMAGGSTDCAAVLFGMNRLFDLKLDRKALMERGVKLGADVPYCLMRTTALSEGIGDPDPGAAAEKLQGAGGQTGDQCIHEACLRESEAGLAYGSAGYRRHCCRIGKGRSEGDNGSSRECA